MRLEADRFVVGMKHDSSAKALTTNYYFLLGDDQLTNTSNPNVVGKSNRYSVNFRDVSPFQRGARGDGEGLGVRG